MTTDVCVCGVCALFMCCFSVSMPIYSPSFGLVYTAQSSNYMIDINCILLPSVSQDFNRTRRNQELLLTQLLRPKTHCCHLTLHTLIRSLRDTQPLSPQSLSRPTNTPEQMFTRNPTSGNTSWSCSELRDTPTTNRKLLTASVFQKHLLFYFNIYGLVKPYIFVSLGILLKRDAFYEKL